MISEKELVELRKHDGRIKSGQYIKKAGSKRGRYCSFFYPLCPECQAPLHAAKSQSEYLVGIGTCDCRSKDGTTIITPYRVSVEEIK